jgi:hypothetical protein
MNKYSGTKEVIAKPMTRGEYNSYRGWETPANEDPNEEGYLVEYLDSPNKNHELHQNYISWSPKDVFDRSYKDVSDFKSRLILEKSELDQKIDKLNQFIQSENFSKVSYLQQSLMVEQIQSMRNYSHTLERRLSILL